MVLESVPQIEEAPQGIDRRNILKSLAFVAGAASLEMNPRIANAAPTSSNDGVSDRVEASATRPIAHTHAGDVRGYLRNGIATFKGVPYADTTEGDGRFAPPRSPASWKGIRSSMQYGSVCPQGARDGWTHDELAWLLNWDDGHAGEDCLCLNVWTPALDAKPRPVMVWLHGGGFTAGSSQELRSYDGENLAKKGDVIVVSVNHRLGVLGFLNLSQLPGGEELPANVGLLDIVAALEWVRDNIHSFGGDPRCVTIFGQSGGGGKVNALMSMPSAAGLFHRAIVQSGSMTRAGSLDESKAWTQRVLAELNMQGASVNDLRKIPTKDLIDASTRMLADLRRDYAEAPMQFDRLSLSSWGPVLDSKVLPRHPGGNNPQDPGYSIPLLLGTVRNEFSTGIDRPEWLHLGFADVEQKIRPTYGERSSALVEQFRRSDSSASPLEVWSRIMTCSVRRSALLQAQAKSFTDAAAYLYWFLWHTPVLDSRPLAYHCSELPFVFANTGRDVATEGNPEAAMLADKVSSAWINFARHGDPNSTLLPHWPSVTGGHNPTMIFDRNPIMRVDPDKAEQEATVIG